MTTKNTFDALVDRVLADCGYRDNPYFIALRDGSFDKSDFVETQIQFYFAVVFFARPMAAVAAKIPHPRQRVEVLRNVWEEHGEGDVRLMHGETFLELLARLAGITPADVEARALWPEVRAFNTALVGAAVLDEFTVSVAMMGVIERMFADISSWIGRGIVARGFLTEDRLIHYKLHEKIDWRHSDDFFQVLRPDFERSAEDRYYVEQGLRLGAYVFDRLYRDLHGARSRRALSDGHGRGGSHTRVR
jgi:pyrroloquinoline-quinone synthase